MSRSLAYGLDHLRSLLAERPHERESIVEHLDEMEELAVGYLGSRETFESLALATGGSREQAAAAIPSVLELYACLIGEHLERRRATGLVQEESQSPLAHFARELGIEGV